MFFENARNETETMMRNMKHDKFMNRLYGDYAEGNISFGTMTQIKREYEKYIGIYTEGMIIAPINSKRSKDICDTKKYDILKEYIK